MKTGIFTAFALFLGLVAADCHADNCANHVTGTFAGIGVAISARVSLCNDFLRTTVRPPPRTVTTTSTKFVVHPSKSDATTASTRPSSFATSTTTSGSAVTATTSPMDSLTSATTTAATVNALSLPSSLQVITRSVVPTFAASECPGEGQFASACSCWSRVTPRVATLPASTVTVTATVSVNVACSPAATAVSNTTRFPCSNGFGMCSCLRTGDGVDDGNDVGACVRVGSGFFDDPSGKADAAGGSGGSAHWEGERGAAGAEMDEDGASSANWNVTGPCWFARECNVDSRCKGPENVCVFDDSCLCGKRRCYQAVAGCGGMEVPPSKAKGSS